MTNERIEKALEGATDTQSVSIGEGVLGTVADLYAQSFGDRPAVVVGDENTFAVAGREVQGHLEAAGRELREPYVFPGTPTLYAEYGNIEALIASLREHDAIPVAVGSGSLNDIAKRAAFECERPYMSVATAASMDGYTAFGAAITKDGYKRTMTCPAPHSVLADVGVLTGAPPKMTAAGYARPPEQGDGGRRLARRRRARDRADRPARVVARPGPAPRGHRAARRAAGRRPAGDGGPDRRPGHVRPRHAGGRVVAAGLRGRAPVQPPVGDGGPRARRRPPLSHGFKVGVGSLAIASLYERLLERDLAALDADAICSAWPAWDDVERNVRAAHTTPGLDDAAVTETREKYVDAGELEERLALLAQRWPDLRERVRAQLLGPAELREMLRAAGCPTHPEDIGLSVEAFRDTFRRAQMIRRRYTVLDLANETGLLDELVAELFAEGGFWAPATARSAR